METFNDKFLHSIDAKGRLQLSRHIRERFRLKKGDRLHLLPNAGDPPFLEIRTEAQWKDYRKRFMEQASGAVKRDFIRFVELSKEVVVADAQGRISIPRRLREMCGLDSDVAVINIGPLVEVWNKNNVNKKATDMVKAFNDVTDSLI